jgi:hypothetical protein
MVVLLHREKRRCAMPKVASRLIQAKKESKTIKQKGEIT